MRARLSVGAAYTGAEARYSSDGTDAVASNGSSLDPRAAAADPLLPVVDFATNDRSTLELDLHSRRRASRRRRQRSFAGGLLGTDDHGHVAKLVHYNLDQHRRFSQCR
jgi:hypothetical protein